MNLIVRLPLEELAHPDGVPLRRRGPLGRDEIKPLLAFGSDVDLVVATIGAPLRWRRDDEMREFWRVDASTRIAEPDAPVHLHDFADDRCFLAYLWSDDEGQHRTVELQELH